MNEQSGVKATTDSMLRALGGATVAIRHGSDFPVSPTIVSPAIVDNKRTVLFSAVALEEAAQSAGCSPDEFLDGATGVLIDGELCQIEGHATDCIATIPVLYRVRLKLRAASQEDGQP